MDETGVANIEHYKLFVMIAVMMTCQVLTDQREIMWLGASLTRKILSYAGPTENIDDVTREGEGKILKRGKNNSISVAKGGPRGHVPPNF